MAELNVKGLKEICAKKTINYPACIIDSKGKVIGEWDSVKEFVKSEGFDKKQVEYFRVGIRDMQRVFLVYVLDN